MARREEIGTVGADPSADHAIHIHVVLRTIADAVAVLDLQLRTLVVALGDEVGDPGHGVRAVDRRGAVLQDFDPLDGQKGRESREIDEARAVIRLHRRKHLAFAVQQHQRGGDAQAAQVDVGGAGGEVLRQVVRVVLGAAVGGELADEVAHVLDGVVGEFVRVIFGKRGRRCGVALDAAAGVGHHDHFLHGAGCGAGVRLGGAECGAAERQGGERDAGEAY